MNLQASLAKVRLSFPSSPSRPHFLAHCPKCPWQAQLVRLPGLWQGGSTIFCLVLSEQLGHPNRRMRDTLPPCPPPLLGFNKVVWRLRTLPCLLPSLLSHPTLLPLSLLVRLATSLSNLIHSTQGDLSLPLLPVLMPLILQHEWPSHLGPRLSGFLLTLTSQSQVSPREMRQMGLHRRQGRRGKG